MNKLRTLLVLFGLVGGMVLAPVPAVQAFDILNSGNSQNPSVCNNPNASQRPSVCNDNQTSGGNPLFGPQGILTSAIRVLAIIAGIVAVVVAMISGLRMITANGDANSFAKARKGLIYALAGLAIAVTAQTLVAFILTKI